MSCREHHPLRVALIEDRAEALEIASARRAVAANFVEAYAELRHHKEPAVALPKWTEPKLKTWNSFEVCRRVVEEGLVPDELARGRPLLPMRLEFPRTQKEFMQFSRPEARGLQISLSDSSISRRAQRSDDSDKVPAQLNRWCQPKHTHKFGDGVLAEAGWLNPSFKSLKAMGRSSTAEKPNRCKDRVDPSASLCPRLASRGSGLSSDCAWVTDVPAAQRAVCSADPAARRPKPSWHAQAEDGLVMMAAAR